jgi:hypothetical protein
LLAARALGAGRNASIDATTANPVISRIVGAPFRVSS